MKNNPNGSFQKIALVSTPWPLYNRPSIQIGTLKAYLRSQFPELQITAYHFYLKVSETIGYRQYNTLSERTWLAETVYAALLYPERIDNIEKLFYREAVGNKRARAVNFKTLVKQVKEVTKEFLGQVPWGDFGLAGFSISLCQLTASIYCIRQIKKWFPDLVIVVGGSLFEKDSISNLLEMFPEINIVVIGEGELPLSRLVQHLQTSQNLNKIPFIPGTFIQNSEGRSASSDFNQMTNLTRLIPPEYDDYFDLLKTFNSDKSFFPVLPIEVSRGCWWRRTRKNGKHSGCAFCNLNLQWNGYRSKAPLQVVSEIDHLTTKHRTLSVAFTDNLLPVKTSGTIFKKLGQLNKDLNMFGEIRASTPRRVLSDMRTAGMNEVQIGIESLSTRLLVKLNKGTTTIQNLEIMKNCEEFGITNSSNLILCFPGSDPEDVSETLRNIEFAFPFRPLKPVRFWLGLGSPVWQNPRGFGIRAVFNHPNYSVLFPPEVFKAVRFIIQAYQGDLVYQRKLWQPVKAKLRLWEKAYDELHKGPKNTPILSYRDGRDFLIVHQKLFKREPMIHRMEGTSRAIYLFCQRHRSIQSIIKRFSRVSGNRIRAFLKMMVDKKLMFEEDEKYLSLAVPVKSTGHLKNTPESQ